jgi:hypothetical protein
MYFHGDIYASVVVKDYLYVVQDRNFYCMDKKSLLLKKTLEMSQPIIKLIVFSTNQLTYILCVGWYESMVQIFNCKSLEF